MDLTKIRGDKYIITNLVQGCLLVKIVKSRSYEKRRRLTSPTVEGVHYLKLDARLLLWSSRC